MGIRLLSGNSPEMMSQVHPVAESKKMAHRKVEVKDYVRFKLALDRMCGTPLFPSPSTHLPLQAQQAWWPLACLYSCALATCVLSGVVR